METELSQADLPSGGRERAPGYREITEALIADIRARVWQIGDQLPTEAELVDRFGASRNTIRESLRELDTFGYIKRRRGTRSILLAIDPAEGFVNSVKSIGELLQYSRRTTSKPVSVGLVTADDALAERLGVAAGSEWLKIEVLRIPTRGTLPIGFSEIYVDGRYAGLADQIEAEGTIYRRLETEYGITYRRVEQQVEAAPVRAPIAGHLKVPVGSPILLVRTDFVTSAGDIVEIGFGHFTAGRYRMEIMLERGPNGRVDE
jgi:DNA-binding GntR family transcriptional regulator